jgi:hypothetical protein
MISNNPPVINAGADYTILRDCICVKGQEQMLQVMFLLTLGSKMMLW